MGFNSGFKGLMFMGPCIVIIFWYINPNMTHKTQTLFYLTTALYVSGVTITHLQEHKTTVTVTSCCSYSCFVLLKMGDSDGQNM